jgi:hypothetical protein
VHELITVLHARNSAIAQLSHHKTQSLFFASLSSFLIRLLLTWIPIFKLNSLFFVATAFIIMSLLLTKRDNKNGSFVLFFISQTSRDGEGKDHRDCLRNMKMKPK